MIKQFLVTLFVFTFVSGVRGEPPLRFNYQAKVTDSAGAPLNQTAPCTFQLFTVPSGGTPVFTEATSVMISAGILNHAVGSVQPLPAALLSDAGDLYLQVIVNGTPIVPRTKIESAPFAVRAASAATADSGPSGSFIMTTSTVAPAGYIFTGTVVAPSASGGWDGGKAAMPTARGYLAAAAVNNKVYAIGGHTGTNSAANEEYDPATNTWAAKAPMPTARYFLAAAAVNGRIYAIGGWTVAASAVNEEYDPATNTWTAKAAMPAARERLAAAAVNNKVYAIGGFTSTNSAVNEEYDPATNIWTAKAAMPTARQYLAAAAVNGKVYAIGGYASTYSAANEEYNPATNTWTAKAAMPTARFAVAAAAVNGKVYAIGGLTNYFSAANEEYDPVTNTWAAKAAMLTGRGGLAAAAVNGKVYAIGGDTGTYNATNEEFTPPDPGLTTLYVHRKN